jgi:type II secretory pathway pseudopilin PulG
MSAAAPLPRAAAAAAAAAAPVRVPARPARATAAPRPRLVLVSQRRSSAGRLPFFIVVGVIMVGGLIGVLLLHMIAAQDAFRATALQQRLQVLTDQEQQLSRAVDADSAPAALRRRAVALGMLPTTVTSIQQLRDGRAVGVRTAITPSPPPAPPATTTTTTTTAGKSGTKPTKQSTKQLAKHGAKQPAKHGAKQPAKHGAKQPAHHPSKP